MPIKVDPSAISIDSRGEVSISDASARAEVEKADMDVVPDGSGTNSGSCGGTNLACNNTGDCTGSTNTSRCNNSGRCFIVIW